jgi:hypothetical protein
LTRRTALIIAGIITALTAFVVGAVVGYHAAQPQRPAVVS